MARNHEITRGKWRRWREVAGRVDLDRRLDEDERDSIAAARVAVPTMLLTVRGAVASAVPALEPPMTKIARAVDVPRSGQWLPPDRSSDVAARLLDFLDA